MPTGSVVIGCGRGRRLGHGVPGAASSVVVAGRIRRRSRFSVHAINRGVAILICILRTRIPYSGRAGTRRPTLQAIGAIARTSGCHRT